MNISKGLISTGDLALVLGLAVPASAQHHGGGGSHGGSGGSGHSAVQRSAPPQSAPRQYAPRVQRGDNGSRGAAVVPRDSGGRAYNTVPRGYSGPATRGYAGPATRGYAGPATRGYAGPVTRGYAGPATRGYSGPARGYVQRNDGYYRRGGYGYGYGGIHVAPFRFYRPYYTFRPRLSLGFGLWVGYPIPYYDPFYYPDYYYYGDAYPPADYPYPPSTAYPPSAYPAPSYPQSAYPPDPQSEPGSINVQPPNQASTGGLSFEITPGDAEVFVDGNRVGTVDQFTPTSQPLGLPAGRHQVNVRAPGYRSVTFDVNIVAGQVIPYQGSLER